MIEERELPTENKIFLSQETWRIERPHILVVACSDGRYQTSLDEFLVGQLGIRHYDRLYTPGGPGALVSSSFSYFRGEQFRQEAHFLVEAHQLEEIILVFHGPAPPDGPVESICADYRRKMPYASVAEIAQRQESDLEEVVAAISRNDREVRLRAFRAEVEPTHHVYFRPLKV